MAIAIALWSLELAPGKEEVVVPQADIRVSNAALGEKLQDQDGRTVVKISYSKHGGDSEAEDEDEDEESVASFILCALTAGKSENAQVDLVLEEGNAYKIQLVGTNPVSLSGNYIDQVGADQPPFDDDDEMNSDIGEDAFDLRDVSSDVEVDPEELDGIQSDASRFEEVEATTQHGKRPRESDTAEKESKSSKAEKNKKLKKDNGEAIPVGQEASQVKPAEKEKKDKKDKKEKKDKKVTKEIKELPNGLKIQDATIGTGPQAKKGDKLLMRYVGKLQDGKIFDKNTKGKPFSFNLGAGEVIKGWDEGLVGMQVGGERVLTIPPKLGYGKRGSAPEIPGNATLIFEVKLLGVN
ncbi:hypothetical protein AGABI1DRAFT_127097 [Agaricus bisporus var. burnettii JB137-S8]|uniref:peptidylprolyl isomerase n=2 Tax=Agaricus bisporus var. burnettii TaxID=192524 RepID=K5WZT6_AGABU|nr:uncharacterized protein AGABI1DRAFT_127097 [Agaricus bisporus var. burnettii JB137-S8]EKM81056.1 hypothetical protein AGABI1DRAFT_127097 [Agaricus bisporus var. burnettii JB137-S8]KAF7782640.1 hypothetical protein Agabi119p4_2016 [Agaricus bisporus var. burnettii]